MKKLSHLMEELGFRRDASNATKEAFIKHLILASTGQRVLSPSEKVEIQKSSSKIKMLPAAEAQMSFDFYSEKSEKRKVGT